MDNPIKSWRRDKENKNTVKIISETGSKVGEIKMTMKITATKTKPVNINLGKLLKLKHSAE